MAGDLYEQGYYETGTASITQGQTVVTGQGTAWSQIVRPADDFGKHVGMPIPIASVDSDTQITLAYPWPGPTQAAAPYRVTFTPYHVAYRQALQEIGQLLESGNVSALAGLVGAANKVPMFTGPGAMDLTTLGTASGSDVTTAPEDVTAGRLLKVGDNINFYGLRDYGAYYGSTAGRNIDTVPAGDVGLYASSNPGTFPPAAPFFWVETQRQFGNDGRFQRAINYAASGTNEPAEWVRIIAGDGTIGPWRSMVPLRGSNANGEYVRYADGTQICWKTDVTFVRAANSLANYSWTFPAAFSSIPAGIPMCSRSIVAADYTGDITLQGVGSMIVSTGGTTNAFFGYSRIDSAPLWASGSILNCRIGMIGRWF